MSPRIRLIISGIVLTLGVYMIYKSFGLDVSTGGLILDIVCFIVIAGIFMILPAFALTAWVGSGYITLEKHNTLYHCENCNVIYRKYQGKCQKCKSTGWSKKLEETYDWMKYGPGFQEHDWKQYKQFIKLGKFIDRDDYEKRSHEMFMKYWKNEN